MYFYLRASYKIEITYLFFKSNQTIFVYVMFKSTTTVTDANMVYRKLLGVFTFSV